MSQPAAELAPEPQKIIQRSLARMDVIINALGAEACSTGSGLLRYIRGRWPA